MKRFWIIAGALVVTFGSLTLAMLLGSASFTFRTTTQHHQRMVRVMRQHPVVSQLTQAFKDEGTAVLSEPATPAEVERVISERGGRKAAELRQKAAHNPQLRVFGTSDMLYFVFFDKDGVMSDFTLVNR